MKSYRRFILLGQSRCEPSWSSSIVSNVRHNIRKPPLLWSAASQIKSNNLDLLKQMKVVAGRETFSAIPREQLAWHIFGLHRNHLCSSKNWPSILAVMVTQSRWSDIPLKPPIFILKIIMFFLFLFKYNGLQLESSGYAKPFSVLSWSLLDPVCWATTKNFENGGIWGEIQPAVSYSRSYLLYFNLRTQYHKSEC